MPLTVTARDRTLILGGSDDEPELYDLAGDPGEQNIALWAVPRSISTAFERVFVERDDFEVFHEPFSASYVPEDTSTGM